MKNINTMVPKGLAALLFSGGLSPLAALAADGAYIGLEGGINFLSGQSARKDGSSSVQPSASINYDLGQIGGLTTGYAFQSGLRPEFEFDYRLNNTSSVDTDFFPGEGINGKKGHAHAYTYFANLWYDYRTPEGLFSKLHPYAGGGVGFARYVLRLDRFGDHNGSRVDQDSYESTFAYQFGVGVNYDFTRHLSMGIDYRFLQGGHNRNVAVNPDSPSPTRYTIYSRYEAQPLMLNLRYSFGLATKPKPVAQVEPAAVEAPAPVAPLAPVPAPAAVQAPRRIMLRMINFQFDRDELTEPAMKTLDEVAAAFKMEPGLDVEIVGYTDSIGSEAYNLALSQRRANAVLRYLVANGVDRSALEAKGMGKADPIASNDTAEGRAENRRIEFLVSSMPADADVISAPSTPESKAAALATPAEGAAQP